MTIGGISAYGSYGVGSVYNRYQKISGIDPQRLGALSGFVPPVQAARPVKGGAAGALPSTDSLAFIKDYQSKTGDLMSAANALREENKGGVLKRLSTESGAVSEETVQETAAALEKLVDGYNDTTGLLEKNTDRGTGVLRQLGRMDAAVGASENLDLVGISKNDDGSLSFDKDAFTKALKRDPGAVKNAIGGQNGIAGNLFQAAAKGMQTSSASLLGGKNEGVRAAAEDSMRAMSAYTKSGAYNMSNFYAVGVLMNMNI